MKLEGELWVDNQLDRDAVYTNIDVSVDGIQRLLIIKSGNCQLLRLNLTYKEQMQLGKKLLGIT